MKVFIWMFLKPYCIRTSPVPVGNRGQSVFMYKSHGMLKVFQHFGKHCNSHLEGECLWEIWKPLYRKIQSSSTVLKEIVGEIILSRKCK
jgi:hypothetical protein